MQLRDPSDEQQLVLDAWSAGHSVSIRARPGSGKTTVLLHACAAFDRGPIILLTYNRELCEDTRLRLKACDLHERVVCLTYHALCSQCIALAADDAGLFKAVEDAEQKASDVHVVQLRASAVMMDEVQDFKPIYARLMKLCLSVPDDAQYIVVGDPEQMLYDYEIGNAADLCYLQSAASYFGGKQTAWKHFELTHSFRVTPHMAAFISKLTFPVTSLKSGSNAPVEVYTTKLWEASALMHRLLAEGGYESTALLVAYKRRNAPLRKCLNEMSAAGTPIYIQGEDGSDARIRVNKLHVSSWHAAKGAEFDTVVVFGIPNGCASNPLHVAASRARKRLVIINDRVHPCDRLIVALRNLQNAGGAVRTDEATDKLVSSHEVMPDRGVAARVVSSTLDVEHMRMEGSVSRKVMKFAMPRQLVASGARSESIVCIGQTYADVSRVYELAVRMCMEYSRKGKVRMLEDIRSPCRLEYAKWTTAIRSGHMGRLVTPKTASTDLLPTDLQEDALRRYVDPKTAADWCHLACAALSWNGYHHQMRQLLPCDRWVDSTVFDRAYAVLKHELGSETALNFDVRLRGSHGESMMGHSRCHVISTSIAWKCVWSSEIVHGDMLQISMIGSLSKHIKEYRVLNLLTGEMRKLEAQPDLFVELFRQEEDGP